MSDIAGKFIELYKTSSEEDKSKARAFVAKLREEWEDENERRTNADEQRRIG